MRARVQVVVAVLLDKFFEANRVIEESEVIFWCPLAPVYLFHKLAHVKLC